MSTYAFIGVGALGGYYAASLTKAGCEVHYLMRSDCDFVRENGLQVQSIHGDFHVLPEFLYQRWEEMPKVDVVCVSLKATQNHLLFPMLEKISKPGGAIVVMQNGYGLEQQIALSLPDRVVIGGLCFVCVHKLSPGHVQHLDYGAVRFGALSHGADETALLAQIVADFAKSGIETHILQDLILARWQKLMWNIPFNGLCTLLRSDTATLIQHPSILQHIHNLMKEIQTGAALCGASISDQFLDKMINDTRKMKPYKPSMQIDAESGRALEWEAIYQRPLEAVREMGGDMPRVEVLMQQLAFMSLDSTDHVKI